MDQKLFHLYLDIEDKLVEQKKNLVEILPGLDHYTWGKMKENSLSWHQIHYNHYI
jgi:hypothetical protein